MLSLIMSLERALKNLILINIATFIFAVVGYWLGRGLVILINWIVNGFIGK